MIMRIAIPGLLAATLLGLSLGCSGMARDTSSYESDTSALLDTRADQLQACYAKQLGYNGQLTGKLTITFTVEKKTGRLTKLGWDRNQTTVGDGLATCVVAALEGLRLDPVDQRDGEATFVYTFRTTPTAG
jgi:hypothetical protein